MSSFVDLPWTYCQVPFSQDSKRFLRYVAQQQGLLSSAGGNTACGHGLEPAVCKKFYLTALIDIHVP